MKKNSTMKKSIFLAMLILTASTLFACKSEEDLESKKEEGIAAMASGDYETAITDFDEALKLAGSKVDEAVVDTCFYKAAALYASGDIKGAAEVYDSIIDFNEEDYRASFLRGCIYLNEKESAKAKEDFDEAIDRSGDDYEVYLMIYDNLLAAGETDMAQTYLDQALQMDDKSASDYLGKGRLYLECQDYANAISYLETAVEKEAKDARVYLAKAYIASGESDKASDILADYVDKEKPTSDGYALLGNMQMTAGNYSQALLYFQEGIKEAGDDANADLLKGEITALEYTGDFELAKEKMADYLSKYPTDAAAIRENTFLQTR